MIFIRSAFVTCPVTIALSWENSTDTPLISFNPSFTFCCVAASKVVDTEGGVATAAGTVQLLTTDFTPLMSATVFSQRALQASSFTSPSIVATPSLTSTTRAPVSIGSAWIAASIFALISSSFGLQLEKVVPAIMAMAISIVVSFISLFFFNALDFSLLHRIQINRFFNQGLDQMRHSMPGNGNELSTWHGSFVFRIN